MVTHSVVQSLKLAIASRGGTPNGREEDLIHSVRGKLNGRVDDPESLPVKRAQFVHGLAPLVTYVRNTLTSADQSTLTEQSLSELVFELYEVVARRTRLARRYAQIYDSQREWGLVSAALWKVFGGASPPAPKYHDATRDLEKSWSAAPSPVPLLRRRWFVAGFLTLLGCLFNYFVPNMVTVTGRGKLKVIAAGSLFFVVAAVYYLYGPDEFPWFREREDPDDEASEASTANDDSLVMDDTAEESDVLVALRLENEELKRVNRESQFGSPTRPAPAEPALLPPSSPAPGEPRPNTELLNTLTDFGLGNDSGDAAVRALAAGMSQPAAPASPPPPPTTTQTSWAPFSAVERTKTQAGQFLYLLNAAEGLKALDPYWGQKF